MEGTNSPLYIIENQNEKNIDQILDINNENLSEKYNQNESNQNLNMIESMNISSKEAKLPTNKGFVRIFRNIFKKKDNHRKKIIGNRFIKWKKESLKGVKIKKTIMVRISVSREKDLKNKFKNKFIFEKEKEKEKYKSVNKNQIKAFNKNINKTINKYNIKRHNIDNNNMNNKIENKILNNKFNNIGYYEVAKKIKDYKGKNNNQTKNRNNDSINNINNTKIINNENLIPQNKKVGINDGKPSITPRIEKNRNIYSINNPNIQNNKSQNKENNTGLVPTPQRQYNNINITFISSTKKATKDIPINQNNNIKGVYNLNHNNLQKNKQSSNTNNQFKGYYMKYDGYHKDKKEYSLINPKIDQNGASGRYFKYAKNQNNFIRNNKRKISDSDNSFSQVNKTDYNKYKRNTYQTNARNGKNNEKNTIEKYNNKDKNYEYSQNTAKSVLKGGVTTVVQHYSGRRKQYE